jgi:hypothetical protein
VSVVGFLPFASLAAPGMTPTSAETPLGQSQSSVGDFLAGAQAALGSPGNLLGRVNQATGGKAGALGISWARVATFILGFLLIMAGIFTHPAIREKAVEAGKVGAALAA